MLLICFWVGLFLVWLLLFGAHELGGKGGTGRPRVLKARGIVRGCLSPVRGSLFVICFVLIRSDPIRSDR